MQTMGELGVTGVIEVPPAGTLTGLAKRALPGVETVALKTPDDLDAARDLVERHGQRQPDERQPDLAAGRRAHEGHLRHCRCPGGHRRSARATASARVSSLRDSPTVTAPHGGTVVEWLVEDGDPVAPGQPLVRLHPESQGMVDA